MNDNQFALIERTAVMGDLSKISPRERTAYYVAVCRSLGLNPLTQPFGYIRFRDGQLRLYCKRDATDQLRRLRGITFPTQPELRIENDLAIVIVHARDRDGREDYDVGVVPIQGLNDLDRANAIMKAMTKAKRRVTLSLVGLGWMDEAELDTTDIQVVPTEAVQSPIEDNGHESQIANTPEISQIPHSPKDLLTWVNERVQVPYDNVLHLLNALRVELGATWNWPRPAETDRWAQAAEAALRHAVAKTQAQAQAHADPVQLPIVDGSEEDADVVV